MTTIDVTYQDILPEAVTVYIDGVCAHNRTVQEMTADYNDNSLFEIFCADCGKWYNDLDDRWQEA